MRRIVKRRDGIATIHPLLLSGSSFIMLQALKAENIYARDMTKYVSRRSAIFISPPFHPSQITCFTDNFRYCVTSHFVIKFPQEVFFMTQEVLSGLFSLIGIVISGVVSFLVAKLSASKEVDRLKLIWEREDIVSSESDFSEMVSAVSVYAKTFRIGDMNNAVKWVSKIRAQENGKLGALLDNLYIQLQNPVASEMENTLSEIIKEKRQRNSKQD